MDIQIDDLNAPFIAFADSLGSGGVLRRLENYARRHRSAVFLHFDDDGNLWASGSGWKRRSVREDFLKFAETMVEGLY